MKNLMIAAAALSAVASAGIAGDSIDITFVDHIKAGMVEQDVFVAGGDGGDVIRVTVDTYEGNLDNVVFASTSEQSHDPMNTTAIGPFPKGEGLGFSLGDWLGASGSGTYSCENGNGKLSADFQNLVPNGVYTMWSWYVAIPFPETFATYDLPYGGRSGGDSSFVADASGDAKYEYSGEGCLQGSGSQLAEGLAIAYHSDGKAHGAHLGTVGENAHVHLFLLLPASAEMPG